LRFLGGSHCLGDGMIPDDSDAIDLGLRSMEGGGSRTQLNEQVVNTLKDVYRLLESYAPTWYTEELHKNAAAALRAAENVHNRSRG